MQFGHGATYTAGGGIDDIWSGTFDEQLDLLSLFLDLAFAIAEAIFSSLEARFAASRSNIPNRVLSGPVLLTSSSGPKY